MIVLMYNKELDTKIKLVIGDKQEFVSYTIRHADNEEHHIKHDFDDRIKAVNFLYGKVGGLYLSGYERQEVIEL